MPEIGRELTDAVLEVVRERSREAGLSGRALAARVGLTVNTMAMQLRGTTELSLDRADALAVALGLNGLEDLLEAARRRM